MCSKYRPHSSHIRPVCGESPGISGEALDSGSGFTFANGGVAGGYGDIDAVNRVSGVLPLEGSVELGPGVVVYLQMHVVRNASYDVLLGRPFAVLVSGTVVNKPDGRQTITVRCPNSRRELTLPTYARGEGPKQSQTSRAGFRTSMI